MLDRNQPKFVMRSAAALLVVAWAGIDTARTIAADDAEWASVRGRFVYEGTAPEPDRLAITKDIAYCSEHGPRDETLVVNGDNGGLANVVVSLYLGRRAAAPAVHDSYEKTAADKVTLTNEHCRFEPHVALLRTSQTLEIKNTDPVGHNTKIDTSLNPSINPITPAGETLEHRFGRPERGPAAVSCSIHPWMRAWVVITDHPYVAASDADGKFEIANLPVGKWTFSAWHEKAERSGRITTVERDGKRESWARGRFELTIQPGENDLGEIKVDRSLF